MTGYPATQLAAGFVTGETGDELRRLF